VQKYEIKATCFSASVEILIDTITYGHGRRISQQLANVLGHSQSNSTVPKYETTTKRVHISNRCILSIVALNRINLHSLCVVGYGGRDVV
jgi:hypothetical protein